MFGLFERLLKPTDMPEHPEPPPGLVGFYWHFARQAKGLLIGLFAAGFAVALTPYNLMWCFVGVTVGTAIGVLPGLGPALTIALLLPLTYLGGMFYPISILPDGWKAFSRINPLFYAIDGFRNCAIGHGDVALIESFAVIGIWAIALFVWAATLIARGHRLRH